MGLRHNLVMGISDLFLGFGAFKVGRTLPSPLIQENANLSIEESPEVRKARQVAEDSERILKELEEQQHLKELEKRQRKIEKFETEYDEILTNFSDRLAKLRIEGRVSTNTLALLVANYVELFGNFEKACNPRHGSNNTKCKEATQKLAESLQVLNDVYPVR